MNQNFDAEGQPPAFLSGENSWIKRSCCLILVLIIVSLLLVGTILAFTQKPVNLGSASLVSGSEIAENETSIPPQFPIFNASYKKLTFDQLFSGKQFWRERYDYAWLPDGSFLYDMLDLSNMNENTWQVPPFSFNAQNSTQKLDETKSFSSDQLYAHKSMIVGMGFRHSFESLYFTTRADNISGTKWHVGPIELAVLQSFHWNPSPDSHDFVYVHEYNVYYQKEPEHPENAIQLTSDGSFFNRFGVTNWLYEEEILESGTAVWWSPSGRYVSYLRFDDREVNRVFIPKHIEDDSYVEFQELPYPKAGVSNNTIVAQYIWDKENHKIVETAPPNELGFSNGSYYVLQNKWIKLPEKLSELGKERLVTVWSNRNQNHVYFSLCNELDCVMTLSQSFKIGTRELWAEPKEVGCIYETEEGFLTILPHEYSDKNIYNHVAHISLEPTGTGRITKWIGENFDVINIIGYDIKKDVLVFTAYGDVIGGNNAYKVHQAFRKTTPSQIQNVNSFIANCDFCSDVSLDPTGNRLVIQCVEPFENTKLYLANVENVSENVLLEGKQKAFLPFDKPKLGFGKLKIPSGIYGHYMIMTPPNLPDGKKIPVLFDLYGGPNSKRVWKRAPSPHTIQICSQYEIAIVQIDVRGTAGRGWDVKESVYKKLGQAETDDTLDMIRGIVNKYTFIDDEKIAIMGWSYGAFLTSRIAIKDQGEIVKCAVSVAPVTNFKLYDSAYTERYLGQPSENPEGYEETNLIPHASNISNVKYFLAHGEQDDNVHYQNSARWSEALQRNNIHFTQLVYSNEAHSISGKLPHLFSEIQRFLTNECFNF